MSLGLFAGLGVALSSKEAGVWPSSLGASAHFAETGTSFSRLHKTCASSQACLFWVSWLSAEIRACVIRAGNSKETLGCSHGGSWELQSKAESGVGLVQVGGKACTSCWSKGSKSLFLVLLPAYVESQRAAPLSPVPTSWK